MPQFVGYVAFHVQESRPPIWPLDVSLRVALVAMRCGLDPFIHAPSDRTFTAVVMTDLH